MYALVGLGNPGSKYAATRHNAGFIFLDHLAEKYNFTFKESVKWKADVCKDVLFQKQLLLLKPLTYMNLSGDAVARACAFYRIPSENIVVVHDELDLPVGRVKIVTSRGDGGHKGIRSIMQMVGTRDFARIRIGIGRPQIAGMDVSSFVLAPFGEDEAGALHEAFERAEEGVRLILEKGITAAMNSINSVR